MTSKPELTSVTYHFDFSKVGSNKVHQPHIQKSHVPKIFDKEIPLHNYGKAFDHRSLLKDKHYRSKVWYVDRQ
jgi:hypothetical protein